MGIKFIYSENRAHGGTVGEPRLRSCTPATRTKNYLKNYLLKVEERMTA